ncbi:GPI-linked NAD(P)(+)--arginine ADP-ribosyltransferase 1-like [Sander lucioperca]|uniref:NAD(P)(+)--arginine ADP-ribosyltransferase n=1 Tax=Sander lucioperca TaxID=283035 RepID=A0A8C9YVA6_SANLU|nr:GPI-linked NAD(P)(+)--arginine ADP-ribosyltransferase 1-like [Sander lucioperca]XP_035852907.1 GPI-linked NAD(P)(+)--arginine ADP-ribosyltransferase 1-like [Sander lucioperca]
MAMMVVLAAVLLTYGVSTGIAMKAGRSGAVPGKNSVLPLDMAENSVDDSYNGCKDKMKKRVTKDLENEKNINPNFKAVWDSSEEIVHTKFKKWSTKVLKKDQIVAIYSYTSDKVYRDFNNAVRTQGPEYETTFGYHALHFLLTTAIQAKRANRKKRCLTGYRRVNRYFSQDVKNRHIRFGSFTSASKGHYSDAKTFGEKSCFQIFTCMGADISRYSKYPHEREVLIPPYEVFNVIEIKNRSTMAPDLPCEVVYKVKSTGYISKLNCALFPK